MKNIEKILEEFGITLTEEQKASLAKEMGENYKPIADYEKQKEKLSLAEDKVKTLEGSLEKFKDVDVAKLNETIETLRTDLENKDKDYNTKLADRDFDDILKESIQTAKGKNAKAIQALLDIDTLKQSKNQKDDIAAAIKSLSEAEDSKMLFGEPEASPIGTGSIIGEVKKPSGNTEDAAMRAAMGLPPVTEQK